MSSITNYLDAGYPALYLPTTEQERALREVIEDLRVSGLLGKLSVYVWKCTQGMFPYAAEHPEQERVSMDIMETLNYIRTSMDGMPPTDSLYILFNVKDFLQTPNSKQAFRDAAYAVRTARSNILCIGAHMEVPPELDDVVTTVDFDLPDKEKIKRVFTGIVDAYKDKLNLEVSEADMERAATNTVGLSLLKAENAISRSIVEKRSVDLELLRSEKQAAVKQSGVLELISHGERLDTLGGFDRYKEHLQKRGKYYRDPEAAEQFGLRPPKGCLLVGIAGTGKTLAGKVAGAMLELPVYAFNIGALFKGVVGASESTTANALKLLEMVSPCVVIFDEFEKGFAGLESSGKSDSGVTSRVISKIMTWMQECQKPIYRLATCNTIRNLDPALLRRGRWDAVFGVDLPNFTERKEIFAIHLRKHGRNPDDYDLKELSNASVDFVGAEIESIVDDALYAAYDEGVDLEDRHLITECKGLVPISKTDAEEIQQFRSWIATRATMVSSGKSSKAKGGGKGGNGDGRHLRVAEEPPRNLQ